MARRKMLKGICHICKKNTELSFEHIPPKCAFNKYTKYRSIPFIEYVQNIENKDYKPKSKLQQGGIGNYCLCRNCNSFLGIHYVPEYLKMAQVGKVILQNYKFDKVLFRTLDISPFRFLKQIVSMFVCINEPIFTERHPEILSFLKNPKNNFLPENYRVFMYLTGEGQIRSLTSMYTNFYGLVNEISFPPFGFVLSFNPEVEFPLTDITSFKNYDYDYKSEVDYELNRLPTHLPYPIDYRTLEEIHDTMKKNKEFLNEANNKDF